MRRTLLTRYRNIIFVHLHAGKVVCKSQTVVFLITDLQRMFEGLDARFIVTLEESGPTHLTQYHQLIKTTHFHCSFQMNPVTLIIDF